MPNTAEVAYKLFDGLLVLFRQPLGQLVVLRPLEILANETIVGPHLLGLDGSHQLFFQLWKN